MIFTWPRHSFVFLRSEAKYQKCADLTFLILVTANDDDDEMKTMHVHDDFANHLVHGYISESDVNYMICSHLFTIWRWNAWVTVFGPVAWFSFCKIPNKSWISDFWFRQNSPSASMFLQREASVLMRFVVSCWPRIMGHSRSVHGPFSSHFSLSRRRPWKWHISSSILELFAHRKMILPGMFFAYPGMEWDFCCWYDDDDVAQRPSKQKVIGPTAADVGPKIFCINMGGSESCRSRYGCLSLPSTAVVPCLCRDDSCRTKVTTDSLRVNWELRVGQPTPCVCSTDVVYWKQKKCDSFGIIWNTLALSMVPKMSYFLYSSVHAEGAGDTMYSSLAISGASCLCDSCRNPFTNKSYWLHRKG